MKKSNSKNLCSLRSDIQTISQSWFSLLKLDVLYRLNYILQKWIGNQKRKRTQESETVETEQDVTLKRIKGVRGPNSYNLFCVEFFKTGTGNCYITKIQFTSLEQLSIYLSFPN